MSSHDHHAHGAHEKQDFDFTHLLWVVPVSIVMLVTYVLICMYGYRGASSAELIEKHSILADTSIFAFRAHERELLSTYGWQNKETGAVRIPIDQAMNLVVQSYQAKPQAATDLKPNK
jgi:hypothetical protein